MTAPTLTDLRREADLAIALDRAQESREAAEHDLVAFVPRDVLEARVTKHRAEVARLEREHAAALQRLAAPRRVLLGGGLTDPTVTRRPGARSLGPRRLGRVDWAAGTGPTPSRRAVWRFPVD